MKTKNFFAILLGAIVISFSALLPVSASEVDNVEATEIGAGEVSIPANTNTRAIKMWNQYVPKVNASGVSNEMILFVADKSTVTFRVVSLKGIPNVNIGVVGFFYDDWTTVTAGRTVTFTGLTPGERYNARFSCFTNSGTALMEIVN